MQKKKTFSTMEIILLGVVIGSLATIFLADLARRTLRESIILTEIGTS